MSGSVDLTQGKFVMVLVVQDVEERREERVKVVENRELGDDLAELLIKSVLGKLDLSHVEVPNTRDFEVLVDNSGGLSHGCVEDDIDKVGRCGHRRDALETCDGRHDDSC